MVRFIFWFPLLVSCTVALEILFWWLRWATLAVVVFIVFRIVCRSTPKAHTFQWKQASTSTSGRDDLLPPDAELMFFVHGWPDDERIWEPLTRHFSTKYICAALMLPNFGDAPIAYPLGYTLDSVVDCIALTLEEVLDANGRTKCILVAHDWGAILATYLQRKRPELVSKMVIHEVECRMWDASQHPLKLKAVITMGVAYQWWLVTAFLLSTIPVFGTMCGASMTRQIARAMGSPLPLSENGEQRIHAGLNYLYLYTFVLDFYLELLGLRPDFDRRNSIQEAESHKVPTLFMFDGKGLMLHSRSFVRELRDRSDCDVIEVYGEAVDHWYIYKSPKVCIAMMTKWLESGQKQGDYTIPVTGFWE